MRHSKMVGLAGCIGVLAVGASLAKEPALTAATSLSTPAGCMDSARGPTHVLRVCGDKHYWTQTAAAGSPFKPGTGPGTLYLWAAANGPGPTRGW